MVLSVVILPPAVMTALVIVGTAIGVELIDYVQDRTRKKRNKTRGKK